MNTTTLRLVGYPHKYEFHTLNRGESHGMGGKHSSFGPSELVVYTSPGSTVYNEYDRNSPDVAQQKKQLLDAGWVEAE